MTRPLSVLTSTSNASPSSSHRQVNGLVIPDLSLHDHRVDGLRQGHHPIDDHPLQARRLEGCLEHQRRREEPARDGKMLNASIAESASAVTAEALSSTWKAGPWKKRRQISSWLIGWSGMPIGGSGLLVAAHRMVAEKCSVSMIRPVRVSRWDCSVQRTPPSTGVVTITSVVVSPWSLDGGLVPDVLSAGVGVPGVSHHGDGSHHLESDDTGKDRFHRWRGP